MAKIEKACMKSTGTANGYRANGVTFMIETIFEDQPDGGIAGTVEHAHYGGSAGKFYISPSGKVIEGPTHFYKLAGQAPPGRSSDFKKNPSLPRGFSLSASEVRAYGKQVTLPKVGFQTKVDLIAGTHSFPRSYKEAWLTHDTNGYYLIAIEPKPAWMKNPTSMRAVHRGVSESDSSFAERAARIAAGFGAGAVNFGNGPISNVTPASARGSKKATY